MTREIRVTRDKETVLRLYKSLVRPQLEYCIIQVWNLHLKQDMKKTGESANKSHKNDSGLQGFELAYEERLKRCGLTTLEKRRSRGDLIEAYKIITGKEFYYSGRGSLS